MWPLQTVPQFKVLLNGYLIRKLCAKTNIQLQFRIGFISETQMYQGMRAGVFYFSLGR